MTTGIITKGSRDSPFFKYRQWNGGDGKFVPGTKVLKWNFYSTYCTQSLQTLSSYPGASWLEVIHNQNFQISEAVWSSNDSNAVATEHISKIRGHSFNLGVALGERKETIDMVVGTVNKFVRSIRYVKHGRLDLALRELGHAPRKPFIQNGKRINHASRVPRRGPISGRLPTQINPLDLKDTSSLWLEIQYGWKPLLGDCYEASVAYEALSKGPRTAKISTYRAVKESVSWTAAQNKIDNRMNLSAEQRISFQYITILTDQPNNIPASLGLTNPLTIAWELVPFSFVVDWFIPIGNYLQNREEIPNLSGSHYYSYMEYVNGSSSGVYTPTYGYGLVGSTDKGSLISHARDSVTMSVPFPDFEPIPKALSSGHIKNAIALLHQLVV